MPKQTETTSWRYQPVFTTDGEEQDYFLIEAYFDKNDKLVAWTDIDYNKVAPSGIDQGSLSRDLAHMLADSWKWIAVDYNELNIGMTFERSGVDVEKMINAMDQARAP